MPVMSAVGAIPPVLPIGPGPGDCLPAARRRRPAALAWARTRRTDLAGGEGLVPSSKRGPAGGKPVALACDSIVPPCTSGVQQFMAMAGITRSDKAPRSASAPAAARTFGGMERPRSRGILSGPIDGPWRQRVPPPEVEATKGLLVTHLGSRFTGQVMRFEPDGALVLRSVNTGLERLFVLRPGSFSVDGKTVTLKRPKPAPAADPGHGPQVTASGSVAVAGVRARVARAGRLLVEGVHDAELVEKVWGDDLRSEGVVVERLDGVDVLEDVVAAFRPAPASASSSTTWSRAARSRASSPGWTIPMCWSRGRRSSMCGRPSVRRSSASTPGR